MPDRKLTVPHPTPAIVTQAAVRRLPRWALLALCLAYVLPGFVGREPWKSADVTSFGIMRLMASGETSWLTPTVLGLPSDTPAWLPHWLGASAMWLLPAWPEIASRLPYMAALCLALFFTWHAVYRFALLPAAQPVPFAFGGQASPVDYARALADSGVMAVMACLGLAQLSHEATPDTFQLMSVAGLMHVLALAQQRQSWTRTTAWGWLAGLVTLGLSGQNLMSLTIAVLLPWLQRRSDTEWKTPPTDQAQGASNAQAPRNTPWQKGAVWALGVSASLVTAVWALVWGGQTWPPTVNVTHASDALPLLTWFAWPVWPLAIWTLWRWRWHLHHAHLAMPLLFAMLLILGSVLQGNSDRVLMLALPALSVLAAFALPTLRRSVSALIDWFSVLFFTTSATVIWVVWVAMVTGYPSKPAANVARLAPGFTAEFGPLAFTVALVATLVWLRVVAWRLGRHQPVIWKSLVLPATGGVLCWLLLMTLWLPLLDYGRSYGPIARRMAALMAPGQCVQTHGLTQAQLLGLMHQGGLNLRRLPNDDDCTYLIVPADRHGESGFDEAKWAFKARLNRLNDRRESLLLFTKISASQAPYEAQASGVERGLPAVGE